jgi:hypothetical protein
MFPVLACEVRNGRPGSLRGVRLPCATFGAAEYEPEIGAGCLVVSRLSVGPLLVTGSFVSGLMCGRELDVTVLAGSDFSPQDVMGWADV